MNAAAYADAMIQPGDMPTKLPVTVVIPARSEALRLKRLLPLLADFARVVVVESQADPDSEAAAARHGADFMVFEWQGGHPKKRTWALLHASILTEWTLFLDADEEPTPRFIAELRLVLPTTRHAGFWIQYDTMFLGRLLRHGVPQRKLALVRTGKGEYEQIDDRKWTSLDMEVHEHLIVQGSVASLRARCIHREDKSIDDYCRRHAEYAAWEGRRYLALPTRGSQEWRRLTTRQQVKYGLLTSALLPAAYFLFAYVMRLGFLDGRPGLLHATLKASYFAQIQAAILQQMAVRAEQAK